MKVLITGVAGFIGSNVAQALLDKGYHVVGYDNMSQGDKLNIAPFMSHPNFEIHYDDIRDEAKLKLAARGCKKLLHLAAYKIPRYNAAEPADQPGAREARDGQGSDAQQQGKEETEAGQEPEKGRRRAVAVRLRQVAAEPVSRQEGLTATPRRRPGTARPARRPPPGCRELLFPNCIVAADATA